MNKPLTHGALFNGISGFPLAAAWAGIETTWTCEIDEWCNKQSKRHFPKAKQYNDIKDLKNPEYVDIISGGFPCQPFSIAGNQLAQQDDRHLWPEMLRIITEVRPAYVIGENVTGIISLALDEVLASLEDQGYTCETVVLPACAVDAPHRRDRVWIVAYRENTGFIGRDRKQGNDDGQGSGRDVYRGSCRSNNGIKNVPEPTSPHPDSQRLDREHGSDTGQEKQDRQRATEFDSNSINAPDPTGEGLQGAGRENEKERDSKRFAISNSTHEHSISTGREELDLPGLAARPGLCDRGYYDRIPNWANFPTQPPLRGRNDGLPTGLARRRSGDRARAIKAYGNAIVPQVAYEIFKAIVQIETTKNQ